MSTREPAPTLVGKLVRTGFYDAKRAQTLCADKDLQMVLGPIDGEHPLFTALGYSADPDLALLTLVRICEGLHRGAPAHRLNAFRDLFVPTDPLALTTVEDQQRAQATNRLFSIIGFSQPLCDDLVRHPHLLDLLLADTQPLPNAAAMRARILQAIGAPAAADPPIAGLPKTEATSALRRTYREILIHIAAVDLTAPEPTEVIAEVTRALADLAAAALEGALSIARSQLLDHGRGVRFAVLGMGKCGGRELNYVSDVDVIYVAEPAPGFDQEYAARWGTVLGSELAKVCSAPGVEPALWPVDAALRPEGKQGPLVRTVESHLAYYGRWAQTWEFQALLKARLVAGDQELGARYLEAVTPLVWAAASRANFVEDAQAMRRRVEEHVPAQEKDRQLKLGKGGLRDVEFTVQLLQLVHGRQDVTIRSSNTLTALQQLALGGYVGREHAQELANCYRFLRLLEHRLQLRSLRRTHLLPSEPEKLELLARSIGMRRTGGAGVQAQWQAVRRRVRKLQQALFYRPLLPVTARLSPEEASLAPEAAQARLAAIGYRDPAGAMRHITALTEGLTRRAAIQRQLLPVMIGWFSQGADPDQGLLTFRILSDDLGGTHWYLKLLRDSSSAAKKLAFLLSTSKYVGAALARSPESIAWLDTDEDLEVFSRERLTVEAQAILQRADSASSAMTLIRALRRRELARISCAELLRNIDPQVTALGVTDAAEVVIAAGLQLAETEVSQACIPAVADAVDGLGTPAVRGKPAVFAVIAMGRMGGREMGYGSDADVMFVYETAPGYTDAQAQAYAQDVAVLLRSLVTQIGSEPELPIDADLRPEGRNGPLVRSLESYEAYYARWSQPWESQALLRARPIAGDLDLQAKFIKLIDPLRYPAEGLDATNLKEIRRLKARMEAERLPRGADPLRHLKLGRGSITDVEWVVQMIQLQHGAQIPELRTTETVAGLEAAQRAGLVSAKDAQVLLKAWRFASNLRDANVLWTGRAGGEQADMLPVDRKALEAIGRVLGYPQGTASQVQEDYQRRARRARKVMERLFYGEPSR